MLTIKFAQSYMNFRYASNGHSKMSFYGKNSFFPTNVPIPNGFPVQLDKKPKNKTIFLDVTPAPTPKVTSPNAVVPMRNNLVDPYINRDIIYENIKPVFMILRLMGVLPLTRPTPGVNEFHLISPAMIYSLTVFIALVSYVLYLSLHKVQILRNSEGKFEEAVIEYLFTVYLFPLIVVPILWYETRKIASVLNGWVEFEVTYKQLSNRILPIKLYKKSLLIAIIIPILSTTSVIVTHVTMVHFKTMQILPYVFLENLTYMLGGYWYLLCEILSLCANVLADDFQLALRHVGPAGKVAQYRALWLRLSKLARNTGVANCYTFTFVNLYLFLIITLSIYGLLSKISEGFGTKDIGLALTALCSVFLLFFICDEAHYASHNIKELTLSYPIYFCREAFVRFGLKYNDIYLKSQRRRLHVVVYGLRFSLNTRWPVRTNFQKKLLMVELSWMNTDAQTEVNMFLRATEMNPSQISLGGFFDVNRTLFKSLLATMVTYLVVLLQFQISIPENMAESPMPTDVDGIMPNVTNILSDVTTTSTTITTILTTLAKRKKKN